MEAHLPWLPPVIRFTVIKLLILCTFLSDKFDQFWAINRKLMECLPEEGFKFIPFRIHFPCQPSLQRLIKPQTDDGRKVTLEELLQEFLPSVVTEGALLRFVSLRVFMNSGTSISDD